METDKKYPNLRSTTVGTPRSTLRLSPMVAPQPLDHRDRAPKTQLRWTRPATMDEGTQVSVPGEAYPLPTPNIPITEYRDETQRQELRSRQGNRNAVNSPISNGHEMLRRTVSIGATGVEPLIGLSPHVSRGDGRHSLGQTLNRDVNPSMDRGQGVVVLSNYRPKLPQYRHLDDIEDFLKEYEDVATQEWSDRTRIVKLSKCFEGAPRKWYLQCVPKPTSYTWPKLKQMVRQQFLPRDYHRILLERLSSLRWDQKTPVRSYVTKIKKTCQRMSPGMSDDRMATYIE